MSGLSVTPNFSALELPIDAWSAPFWAAAAEHRLLMPRCSACGTFRWPAGPFCPACHAQPLEWVPTGLTTIYSYTILPVPGGDPAVPAFRVPVLAVFGQAPGVRLASVLVEAEGRDIAIGAALEPCWLPAANGTVPAFRLASGRGTVR
ncbi:MAG: zinc ribbon domain-containing protein [Sphingobium sp.]